MEKNKYLICLQFIYINQTKKFCFQISVIIKRTTILQPTVSNIVEIWKKLQNGSFFRKILVKIYFKIVTITIIPKMTR